MAAIDERTTTGVSFSLTDEQKELRALAREFAEKEIRPFEREYDEKMQHPVDVILATPTLSDAERAAILGGNAARLFGMELTKAAR